MSLNDGIRELVDELANAVRHLYRIPVPICDIDHVVETIGGKVIEDASLDGYSDGRIRKTGVNSFVISVSPFQSKERRNFVIAHELGHLFLHMGFKTNSTRWKAQNDTACYHNENLKVEYQANEFAVAFLMPQQDYELVLRQNMKQNMVDTSTIAEYFCVTIETAAIRGKRLGYLRW